MLNSYFESRNYLNNKQFEFRESRNITGVINEFITEIINGLYRSHSAIAFFAIHQTKKKWHFFVFPVKAINGLILNNETVNQD